MGFQTKVYRQPAPAVAGDFVGCNPRTSVNGPTAPVYSAGQSAGYIAAPDYPSVFGGAVGPAFIVGRFAWFNPTTGLAANYYTPGSILGFVHREEQALITAFLGEATLAVPQGFEANGAQTGNFYADFAPGPATVGQKVYADPVTGQASAAATGQSVSIAITASLAANGVLTVTVTGGVLAAGQAVVGANVPAGTFITSQLTGSAGSTGTYQCNQGAVVGSEAMTALGKQETRWSLASPVGAGTVNFTGAVATTGVLTVSAGTNPSVGMAFAGAGVPAGAQVLSQLTGTTFLTNVYATIGAEAMTATQGTLGKISTWQA